MGFVWQDEVGGGLVLSVPVGLIVEARLNGARAGKVSAQRGRQRRKYHSCMEGRYLTPHSSLSSEKRNRRREAPPPRQKRDTGRERRQEMLQEDRDRETRRR